MKIKSILPKAALFVAAIIWGSSFIVMKDSVEVIPTFYLLAIRFMAGTLLLALIFCKRLKKLDVSYIWQGGIIGFCLFAAYTFQTFGLMGTTAGKNALLTDVYCVMVPFLWWILIKKRPTVYNFVAATMSIVGIALVSLTEEFTIAYGDGLTLIGGFFFAVHIIAISKFSSDKDPILLTMMQFAWASVLSFVSAFIRGETVPAQIETSTLLGLAYLCVFATTLAMLFQNIGQKYSSPNSASIILSLESVFGVLFSVILGYDKMTLRLGTGFVIIFFAVLISETCGDKRK